MINVYNFSNEDQEQCRINYLEELDVYDDEVITKEYEEDNLYKFDVIKIEDVKKYIKDYLINLFSHMNINTKLDILVEDKVFNVKIKTNDNSIIIGKDGKNLSAIQLLIRQVVRNMTGFIIKINLDVANYKLKKEHLFENDIKKIINEVLTTKISTKLDPMNSYQRRMVHNVASNYYNIETESIGVEPDRYVTIKYIEN